MKLLYHPMYHRAKMLEQLRKAYTAQGGQHGLDTDLDHRGPDRRHRIRHDGEVKGFNRFMSKWLKWELVIVGVVVLLVKYG